ncbi:hypothetical protein [Nocardioides sp. R-C-SC26]|uniref:hypothetical protein n=1 Tax=Nocardioides sp. R-C-SC26 TaxID=2870414 RepID=UPI001E59F380|nr:hypothetical protein [Nocardioides sp. R-C-SC26]
MTSHADVPRLRPGVHAVRRDDHSWQVGVDPPDRVIVPDEESVRLLLDQLAGSGIPRAGTPQAARALGALDAAGLLHRGRPVVRRRAPVAVEGDAWPDDGLATALDRAGVAVRPAARDSVALRILLRTAPVHRDELDPWVADGVPHLVVAGPGRPGVLRLGPLVVPGVTACLRCVDAHESEGDRRRLLVLDQLADRAAAPVAASLWAWAATWIAHEVAGYLDGMGGGLWSASVDVGDDGAPVVRTWARHPQCGCTWDSLP